MNKWFLILTVIIIAMEAQSADKKSFKFGISPTKDPKAVRDEWKPLKKLLEKDCDCLINFEVAKSNEDFENKLSKTQFDLAFVNPFQQKIAHENDYMTLAREKDRSLQGVIIVRDDSKIKTLQDLENQKLAFSKYHPFESSTLVKKKFEEEKVKYEEILSINLDFVVQDVIMGIAVGGAIDKSTYSNQDSEDKKFIRILEKTEKIDSEPFVVKKQLAKKTKLSFKKTLINLSNSQEGRSLLKKLKLKKLI